MNDSRLRSSRRGESASSDDPERPSRAPHRKTDRLETSVLVHVGSLLLLGSWYFAGGSQLSRQLLAWWGSAGVLLTIAAMVKQSASRGRSRIPLHWLWPAVAFNVLVLLSCLNPSFTEKFFGADSLLARTGEARPGLPSTAHVPTSLEHLWLFDALYLTAFNLVLIRRRQSLRALLFFACANGVALAVFGTLQKLASDGLFFGTVRSPNPRFFATFVYGNHWSAFVVLLVGAAGGLIFRAMRRRDDSPQAQSRLQLGVAGLIVIGITPAIAGSRAGILMAGGLLLAYALYSLFRIWRRERNLGQLAYLPLTGLALCVILAIGGGIWFGRGALQERLSDTREQLRGDALQGRRELYHDTWRLVKEEPIFGWGLGTYSKVFQLIRPRPLEARRQYERSYADAHSDWLQSLAEVGLAGTALLVGAGVLPLMGLRARHFKSAVTTCTLAGCALVLLYAAVEFPFGNAVVTLMWWICFFSAIQSARLRDLMGSSAPA